MGMCPVYLLLLSVGGLKDEDGLGQEKNSCRVLKLYAALAIVQGIREIAELAG